jgi:hypothetical protein
MYALNHHNMALAAGLDIQRTPRHRLSPLVSWVVFVTIEVSGDDVATARALLNEDQLIRGHAIWAIQLLKNGHVLLAQLESYCGATQIPLDQEENEMVVLIRNFLTGLSQAAIHVSNLTAMSVY